MLDTGGGFRFPDLIASVTWVPFNGLLLEARRLGDAERNATTGHGRFNMKKEDELALKVTKEIVIKFIEVGRLTVNSFDEVWGSIHQSITRSLKETQKDADG